MYILYLNRAFSDSVPGGKLLPFKLSISLGDRSPLRRCHCNTFRSSLQLHLFLSGFFFFFLFLGGRTKNQPFFFFFFCLRLRFSPTLFHSSLLVILSSSLAGSTTLILNFFNSPLPMLWLFSAPLRSATTTTTTTTRY